MGWRALALALACAAPACATTPAVPMPDPSAPRAGERLLVGPTFWTNTPGAPDYRAVAVDAAGVVTGLYAAVPARLPAGVERVELPGALALPGLFDAHLHLAWIGRSFETLDLHGATSAAAVRERVAAFVAAHPDVRAVTGDGWDQTLFPGGAFPTAADLGPGDRPVVLTRVDGHALWLNDVALATLSAHFARPSDAAARVLRDAAGAPSGVVVDPSDALRAALAVPATAADQERWIEAGLAACADAGLVEVHFMAATVPELEALLRVARAAGRLPLRVAVYLYAEDASFAWLDAQPPGFLAPHPDVRVLGVKLFADGALGSRGAALKAAYSDAPGERGDAVPVAQLTAWAQRTAARAMQIAIHAIGDRANSDALAVIAAAGGPPGLRHRIEHAQVVDPADWARFAAPVVVASLQPTHATADMRWAADRLGAARLVGAYAWRTVLAHGIPLAFGSDAPVASWRPALGLYAAVTRQDPDGQPPGGWRPEERLTLGEAVTAFTVGAAYAAHEEDRRGVLAVGRPLDLTLFDRDPRPDPRLWLDAHVTATVRDGFVRRVIAAAP